MFEPLVADDSNTKYSASVVYIKMLKQIAQAQIQWVCAGRPALWCVSTRSTHRAGGWANLKLVLSAAEL